MIQLITDFAPRLVQLVSRARQQLLISTPYVTSEGTDVVLQNLSTDVRTNGNIWFLTDLSPLNVCQLATDPAAILSLTQHVPSSIIRHLPRLHGKVYIADDRVAIITSANLTAGGILRNYEYGVEIADAQAVSQVRRDLVAFGSLGAALGVRELEEYCQIASGLRGTLLPHRSRMPADLRSKVQRAEDRLLRLRLAGGAPHTVFARTIEYLLTRHGAMSTERMHPLIERIHPDLCDNTIDRVIDGKRFGKKWKHAVRTAQQQLKRTGVITYDGNQWRLARPVHDGRSSTGVD